MNFVKQVAAIASMLLDFYKELRQLELRKKLVVISRCREIRKTNLDGFTYLNQLTIKQMLKQKFYEFCIVLFYSLYFSKANVIKQPISFLYRIKMYNYFSISFRTKMHIYF